MKWISEEYKIASYRKGSTTASGITCRPFFDIHKDDGFVLTHLPTGHSIGAFEKQSQAKKAAEQLQKLDWNFTSPNSRKVKALAESVRKCLRQIREAA